MVLVSIEKDKGRVENTFNLAFFLFIRTTTGRRRLSTLLRGGRVAVAAVRSAAVAAATAVAVAE